MQDRMKKSGIEDAEKMVVEIACKQRKALREVLQVMNQYSPASAEFVEVFDRQEVTLNLDPQEYGGAGRLF